MRKPEPTALGRPGRRSQTRSGTHWVHFDLTYGYICSRVDLRRSQSRSAIGEASVEFRARTEGRGAASKSAGRRLNAAATNLKSTLTLPTASCAATSRLFASKGRGARKQATSQSQL